MFWSDHECASVEKIICPVEQREISFLHDVIRRSVTDVVLSFLAVPRHFFPIFDGLESTLTSICGMLLIMAHYFAGILTYDSCCWIAVFRV